MKRLSPSNWHPRAVQAVLVWLAAWPTLSLILWVISPFTSNWPVPARACERDGDGANHELRQRPIAQSDPAQGSQRPHTYERRQNVGEERTIGALHASAQTVQAAA